MAFIAAVFVALEGNCCCYVLKVTPAIAAGAEAVLHEAWSRDIGTEVAFEADGLPWVGRIELHYHPFNGTISPHGYHHGVSVYCFLNSSCAPVTGSQFLAATDALTVAQREEQVKLQCTR